MFRKQKEEEVERIKNLVEKYPIIGIVDINKLPAYPMQKIKDGLRGKAIIKVAKKTLMRLALEKSSKDLKALLEKDAIQPALIFTEMNPFKLVKYLNENKSSAPAKVGDIAQNDITVSAGVTEFPPGPAISAFKKVGLKTSVEGGKIKIVEDKVVCKAGERITEDLAQIFSMLKMEPMKIGLNVVAIWENGTVYDRSVLEINEEEYMNKLMTAATNAFNLSVEIAYPTKDNIETLVLKAFVNARGLAIEAALPEKDVIEDILAKAVAQAKALKDTTEK